MRAIDGFATLGRGQRLGIFSGSGVGKSTLLGQITRGTDADVLVVCLVGERGREVRGFLDEVLGVEGLRRAVVVVATSDRPPIERFLAPFTAVTIAEHFRDQGQDCLMVMDSVTRFAAAAREIGLAAGEPPTVRGYPPSFFAAVPKLVERMGRTRKGSITGLVTVLLDGDDPNDPVADTLRGLLDGHLMLSRELAHQGHWPAIDVLGEPVAADARAVRRAGAGPRRAPARAARHLARGPRPGRDRCLQGGHQPTPGPGPAAQAGARHAAAPGSSRALPAGGDARDDGHHLRPRRRADVSRFRFRLQRVLDVRRLEEEVARGSLLDAHAAARLARDAAQQAATAHAQGLDALRALLASPHLAAQALIVGQEQQDRLAGLHAEREGQARDLEGEVERRRAAALVARSAVRGLERLEGRRRAAHAVEDERAERVALDEVLRRAGPRPASLPGAPRPWRGSSPPPHPADDPSRTVSGPPGRGPRPHDPA